MDAATLAALMVGSAAMITAVVQILILWGPRRNGHKAVLHELRERLDDCERRERTRGDRSP